MTYHITIDGTPLCDWTGCIAHQHLAERAAEKARAQVSCGHEGRDTAFLLAHALDDVLTDAMFAAPRVAIVVGPCPNS